MASIDDIGKKRDRRGRPKTDATPLMVRVHPLDLAALDAYIAAQPDPKPSRPEVVRILFRASLDRLALLAPSVAPEALTARIEALEEKVASIPEAPERSPEAAMNTMRKAVAENELTDLKQKRGEYDGLE